MRDALVGIVAGLLVVAGILVILGPQTRPLIRRARSIRPPRPSLPAARPAPEVAPPALNPKTQRVLVSATRLAQRPRAPGPEEVAPHLRAAPGPLRDDAASRPHAAPTPPPPPKHAPPGGP